MARRLIWPRRGGDPSRARAALRRAEVDPDRDAHTERGTFAWALSARARMLTDEGAEARQDLERVVGHCPSPVRRSCAGVYARVVLGELCVSTGRAQDALVHVRFMAAAHATPERPGDHDESGRKNTEGKWPVLKS